MAQSWSQRSPASGGAQPGSGGAGRRSYSVMAHHIVDGGDIEVCGGAARAAKATMAPINLLETDEDKGTDNDHEQGTQGLGSSNKRDKNNMWLKPELMFPLSRWLFSGPLGLSQTRDKKSIQFFSGPFVCHGKIVRHKQKLSAKHRANFANHKERVLLQYLLILVKE